MSKSDFDLMKNVLIHEIMQKSFKYDEGEGFTLASGRMSKFYFDMKPITMSGKGIHFISHMYEHLKTCNSLVFGGIQSGADPIASGLMLHFYYKERSSDINYSTSRMFSIRKESKSHGTKKYVEGDVVSGEEVVIVEDVITTGGSTIKAIKRAMDFGLIIKSILVVVDREEGGKENIKDFLIENEIGDVDIITLVKRSEVMEVYNK